ncbi:MAG: YkgJ family cysteine cluster protein [Phycisphaerae bacterium]
MTEAASAWYRDGLRFECTQCGNCCTGPPGYVFLTLAEIKRIAEFLGRTDGTLAAGDLRRVGGRYSLTERKNGDCTFLRAENGRRMCGIYPVRPLQCRSWPFWTSNVESPATWAEASRTCPGIDHGPRFTQVRIDRRRLARSWDEAEG